MGIHRKPSENTNPRCECLQRDIAPLTLHCVSMNPQHPTKLTAAKEKIMTIAVRLDSAMRYRNRHLDKVNEEQYIQCIGTELMHHPAAQIDGITNLLHQQTLGHSIDSIVVHSGL